MSDLKHAAARTRHADRIVAAYLLDRAEQYRASDACRVALEDAAFAVLRGEHTAAYTHGELDDLMERTRTRP